jgi:hypothetical protein
VKDNMIRFVAVGPDEIPIQETPFKTEQAARDAITAFAKRFVAQGYYRDANGKAIPIADIPSRCRIEPTL